MNYLYNYKEESKKNWSVSKEVGEKANEEDLKIGALLRIADATELMQKTFYNFSWKIKD